jgi:D-tyrosyl-tRNA(Tyr) deacylase
MLQISLEKIILIILWVFIQYSFTFYKFDVTKIKLKFLSNGNNADKNSKFKKPLSMKIVIQRVSAASVTVQNNVVAQIKTGLLVLVGIENLDTQDDIDWLCAKINNIRIFNDLQGLMNLSLKDIDGDVIVVSQFTLQASTKKGNRPSYSKASKPEIANPLYEQFIKTLSLALAKKVQSGVFGADMKVALINDGPVTIVMDSKNKE